MFSTRAHALKGSYLPVSGAADGESPHSRRADADATVIKLTKQIRFFSMLSSLLLVILLLSALGHILRPPKSSNSLAKDGLLLAPAFPLVTKIFENRNLIKEISAEVEARWEADMPRGRGFVHVPGFHTEDPDGNIHVVSVFHQLHCLYMMQKSFTRAMQNSSQVEEKEVYHTYHCAELLRQALKCAADPTLDSTAVVPSSPTGRGTSGWNGTHVCRDFDSLFAWTDAHRTNDRVGAGILDGHHVADHHQ
ncbi:hypothetical protein GQ53DRAFT_832844 [Thozetella sp. PMI_491]|nr:hypothetical protein GQ53DRAFT_832844 [Thozetella sp. PMI_491]